VPRARSRHVLPQHRARLGRLDSEDRLVERMQQLVFGLFQFGHMNTVVVLREVRAQIA
jgi:hypothetical protein